MRDENLNPMIPFADIQGEQVLFHRERLGRGVGVQPLSAPRADAALIHFHALRVFAAYGSCQKVELEISRRAADNDLAEKLVIFGAGNRRKSEFVKGLPNHRCLVSIGDHLSGEEYVYVPGRSGDGNSLQACSGADTLDVIGFEQQAVATADDQRDVFLL